MNGYSCYLIDEASRRKLEMFAGGYAFADRRGDHVTVRFGVGGGDDTGLNRAARLEVYGFASDHRGIEAFLVRIDGQDISSDGRYFHLTWSFDKSRTTPEVYGQYVDDGGGVPYGARHSNAMIRAAFSRAAGFVDMRLFHAPMSITAKPALVLAQKDGTDKVLCPVL